MTASQPIPSDSTPVAYLTQTFPSLTQTFVYREVAALERRGIGVFTTSVWQPDRHKLSAEARPLMDRTFYIFPVNKPKFITSHLYFLLTRPHKYVGTLAFVLAHAKPGQRLRTLGHFAQAIYLASEVKKRGVQHLHAHFAINAATIALVISRLLDLSFSFTAHNIFFIDQILLPEKIRESSFISVISEFSRQFLLRFVPGENLGGKMKIVRCGLSLTDFKPPADKPANDKPLLLFVAQLAERKGAPYLVEACHKLHQRGLDFTCVIAGDGPQMAEVQARVKQYGLETMVQLPGAIFQDDLKAYLKRTDIFALPCIIGSDGDIDGIPVALMEAMAMEIATVSTTVSGIPELIEDGVSGLLVPEKDITALADALQRLIEDPALRQKLGQAGREKIIAEFEIDQNAERLAGHFEEVLRRA